MTRLADRILSDCHPADTSFLFSPSERSKFYQFAMKNLSKENPELTEDELNQRARQDLANSVSPAKEHIDVEELLSNAPIFCIDDVAQYVLTLPEGTNFTEVVATMAPPFDKFFVEIQNVPNPYELNAWGTLVQAKEVETTWSEETKKQSLKADGSVPRWILHFHTFLEWEKGHPSGPIAHHFVALAEDGTWFRHSDGAVYWGGSFVDFENGPPFEAKQEFGDFIAQLLFPILLSLSFLNCRNVEIKTVSPPPKLDKKHTKKTGLPLVRYSTLEVAPIKRILEENRLNALGGLAKALHLCRGHFKTFTEDAPLLGKHIGTYWWTPQVRGKQSRGITIKDYRVVAPTPVGRTYREADDNASYEILEAPKGKDPDLMGRALSAHNKTQNMLAESVRRMNWMPLSAKQSEPKFDLAWKIGDALFVCEVKSLTEVNEESQLRSALGQVIRYRQKLAAAGHEPVFAVMATEIKPKDDSWHDLLKNEGITLMWPDVFEERLLGLRRFLH